MIVYLIITQQYKSIGGTFHITKNVIVVLRKNKIQFISKKIIPKIANFLISETNAAILLSWSFTLSFSCSFYKPVSISGLYQLTETKKKPAIKLIFLLLLHSYTIMNGYRKKWLPYKDPSILTYRQTYSKWKGMEVYYR